MYFKAYWNNDQPPFWRELTRRSGDEIFVGATPEEGISEGLTLAVIVLWEILLGERNDWEHEDKTNGGPGRAGDERGG